MSDIITYAGQQSVSATEPACTKPGHCWHHEFSFNRSYASTGGHDEVCCWCGVVKQVRPDPHAHGPHEPGRVSHYGGGVLWQSDSLKGTSAERLPGYGRGYTSCP